MDTLIRPHKLSPLNVIAPKGRRLFSESFCLKDFLSVKDELGWGEESIWQEYLNNGGRRVTSYQRTYVLKNVTFQQLILKWIDDKYDHNYA